MKKLIMDFLLIVIHKVINIRTEYVKSNVHKLESLKQSNPQRFEKNRNEYIRILDENARVLEKIIVLENIKDA